MMTSACGKGGGGKKVEEAEAAAQTGAEKRCAAASTYDLIKVELFRRAAALRGSDNGAFDRLSAYATLRMERPVLKDRNDELKTIECSGRLSLDLPPGVAVVGGRTTLTADIGYTLQAAADGTGDVIILTGIDPVIVPLATVARTSVESSAPPASAPSQRNDVGSGERPPEPPVVVHPNEPPLSRPRSPAIPPPAATPQPPRETQTSRPSFNCRYARTHGEIAVCTDGGLADLDRQMAARFGRAMASGDAGQRAALRRTRDRFLAYRDTCPSDDCIAQSYRGRMQEIDDIMSRE